MKKVIIGVVVFVVVTAGVWIVFNQITEGELEVTEQIGDDEYMTGSLTLRSTAFENNKTIPSQYTCDGGDTNPALSISDVPDGTESLVLIMDDPDAPRGTWDHWVVFNVPSDTTEIPEGQEPEGISGNNSWGKTGYGGPCPPRVDSSRVEAGSPSGEHRYIFKLYALDTTLTLAEGASKEDVESAMEVHILSETSLTGLYRR